MTPLLTALALFITTWPTYLTADFEDFTQALDAMETELPWTWPFTIKTHCVQNAQPFTIRFDLQHGASLRTVNCVRPWRTFTFRCGEVDDAEPCLTVS